uniref:Putative secreted protein n=1 Tax=Anopheles darlingi TaxID=43151 RepID=A0A2M4DJ41_ANODA
MRPARPARCSAAALLTGTTTRLSVVLSAEYHFSLTNPQSMTYTIPGMVTDVSAILVAKTTFRTPFGGVKNTFS